ncbi:hypothetical protein A6R68_19470, partial [Neotoma lepida]
TLPKPNIWADPGSVIALYTPVIIWCEGSWEALEYYLHKQHSTDPWDTQFPLERGNQAKFSILQMSKDFAGIYKCYYKSPGGKSEYSDTLELVITGEWTLKIPSIGSPLRRSSTLQGYFSQSPSLQDNVGFYGKPSLSVWPSPAVTSGESINMQCSSSLGFGRFILIQEGKQHISLTMDSQQNGRMSFQARFALDSVTANHSGTFRCYGYFRNDPHVWSTSSNPLDIFVS